MRYESPGALRMALEARLLETSKRTGLPVTRLRKAVVFERMLARLVRADTGRWVLKGAVALEFRRGGQSRATKDLDLGYAQAGADALATLRAGPGLLEFAGIEAPIIPVLPIEQHVAEKVHAFTRTYGEGKVSSRPKDLIDLVLIGSFARLEANWLRKTLEHIFTARGSHPLPTALPAPPLEWSTPYRRMAEDVGLDGDIQVGYNLAARLVDPILKGKVRNARWNPVAYSWVG